MNFLIVIPARKGSKGVPNKNKKILGDKPLIQHTIEAALEVFDKNSICVSTNDEEVFEIAANLGVKPPFIRPEYLSSDTASSQDVLVHAYNHFVSNGSTVDAVILLQATSPFRNASHIRNAIKLFSQDIDMVVSVTESKTNPYFNLFEENEEGLLVKCKQGIYTRRQDCPKVFEYNGAIYVINSESLINKKIADFNKVVKFTMDEVSSHDIDTMFDWKIAELLVQEINENNKSLNEN